MTNATSQNLEKEIEKALLENSIPHTGNQLQNRAYARWNPAVMDALHETH